MPTLQPYKEIVLLPIGSFEQHGPHLPLNTDNYLIEAISTRVAHALRIAGFPNKLLPNIPLSTCYEHHGKRGSMHFSANILLKFMINLCGRLYTRGYGKIAVLMGHGGIFIMDTVIRHLNFTYPGAKAICLTPYEQSEDENWLFSKDSLHACETETSLMLYLYPELVRFERAVDYVPAYPRPILDFGSIFTVSPDGVWGYPTEATPEKGRIMLDRAVESLTGAIMAAFGQEVE